MHPIPDRGIPVTNWGPEKGNSNITFILFQIGEFSLQIRGQKEEITTLHASYYRKRNSRFK
jgi:hypothetical protein